MLPRVARNQLAGALATVIVPTWNGARLLGPCLRGLGAQTYPRLEIVVADGGSTDDSRDVVQAICPSARFLRLDRNRGFAGNVNAGLRAARGDILLLLNNDAEPAPDWVEGAVEAFGEDPEVGSVASRILFDDRRTINSAGDGLTRACRPFQRGCGAHDDGAWDVSTVVFGASGGAAAYRRSMLRDVGLLDESFFAYLEDVDLAFRAQLRGWTCVYAPAARVYHRGSATGGGPLASYLNGRNLVRLIAKNLPARLVPRLLPGIVAYQKQRALDALRAWRGAAARATLRGQIAGFAGLPRHLADRRGIQARRRVSDRAIERLLTPEPA